MRIRLHGYFQMIFFYDTWDVFVFTWGVYLCFVFLFLSICDSFFFLWHPSIFLFNFDLVLILVFFCILERIFGLLWKPKRAIKKRKEGTCALKSYVLCKYMPLKRTSSWFHFLFLCGVEAVYWIYWTGANHLADWRLSFLYGKCGNDIGSFDRLIDNVTINCIVYTFIYSKNVYIYSLSFSFAYRE